MSPHLVLWYLAGGRLPHRHREWAHRQATRPGWLAWSAARAFVRTLPVTTLVVVGLLVFLDSPVGLALACGGLGLIVGMYYTLSYAVESTDHDLTRYGYPPGTATAVRKARAEAKDAGREARYAAAYRTQDPS